MSDHESYDSVTGEVVSYEPPTAAMRHVVNDLGGDVEVRRIIADVLDRKRNPRAVALIGKDKAPHVTRDGSLAMASALGVSVSTDVHSVMEADGTVAYKGVARVLGPYGQIVESTAIFNLEDAKTRPGGKLDRSQSANLAQTKAINRAMMTAYSAFWPADVANSVDDAPPGEVVEGEAVGRGRAASPSANGEAKRIAAANAHRKKLMAGGDEQAITDFDIKRAEQNMAWDANEQTYKVVTR